MEDLRVYGISISAIGGGFLSNFNMMLSSLVLIATLVYTIIQIMEKFKNNKK